MTNRQTRDQLRDRMHTVAIRMMQDRRPVSLTALRRNGVCGDVGRMGVILSDLCDSGVIPEHAISRRRLAQVDRTCRERVGCERIAASMRECRPRHVEKPKPAPAPDLWAWLRTHYYTPTRREWYRRAVS